MKICHFEIITYQFFRIQIRVREIDKFNSFMMEDFFYYFEIIGSILILSFLGKIELYKDLVSSFE